MAPANSLQEAIQRRRVFCFLQRIHPVRLGEPFTSDDGPVQEWSFRRTKATLNKLVRLLSKTALIEELRIESWPDRDEHSWDQHDNLYAAMEEQGTLDILRRLSNVKEFSLDGFWSEDFMSEMAAAVMRNFRRLDEHDQMTVYRLSQVAAASAPTAQRGLQAEQAVDLLERLADLPGVFDTLLAREGSARYAFAPYQPLPGADEAAPDPASTRTRNNGQAIALDRENDQVALRNSLDRRMSEGQSLEHKPAVLDLEELEDESKTFK